MKDGTGFLQVIPVEPVRMEARNGHRFVDFGKVAFGNLQIEFRAPPRRGSWNVRLGEKLDADGGIDRHPPGSVNFCETRLRMSGGARLGLLQIPTKPFHRGEASVKMPEGIGEVTPFRYAEIEGVTDEAVFRQLVVQAPFDDSASEFESSDGTLNAVWELCKHTMKATTAFGVYIDGERERIPYEGDAYINLLSHYACDLNPDVARRTFEHLLVHPTWPTEWSLQMPMIAEADYEATGDPVLAVRHFEALKKKLLMEKARTDGLLQVSAIVDWPAGERDGYNDGGVDPEEAKQVGPLVNTVANAFHYRALRAMARMSSVLGKTSECIAFDSAAANVSQAFQAAFFDQTRGIYRDGEGTNHASLHANMFPLALGLVPPEYVSQVAEYVLSRGMACSVYGAQFLLEALYLAGYGTQACELMVARSDRSWWQMLTHGSTMTWEAWNSQAKPNLTWNHAWGAAPANIIMRYLLGVRPWEPGYGRILIDPQPGALESVRARVPTPRGPVGISLRRSTEFRLEVEIPEHTTARVVLRNNVCSDGCVLLNGRTESLRQEPGASVIEELSAGCHTIICGSPRSPG